MPACWHACTKASLRGFGWTFDTDDTLIGPLSGGEKRRLSVATALVNAPQLLILDEPTFGQDDRTFVELVGLIRELTQQGVTVISITHDEAFIASLGDHVERVLASSDAEEADAEGDDR